MISNRCARKSLITNCNSIISKNYLRFLVDSNDIINKITISSWHFCSISRRINHFNESLGKKKFMYKMAIIFFCIVNNKLCRTDTI